MLATHKNNLKVGWGVPRPTRDLLRSFFYLVSETAYIYLHGFASSLKSNEVQYLRDRFTEINLDLNVLYLNQANFSRLTLFRQIIMPK